MRRMMNTGSCVRMDSLIFPALPFLSSQSLNYIYFTVRRHAILKKNSKFFCRKRNFFTFALDKTKTLSNFVTQLVNS